MNFVLRFQTLSQRRQQHLVYKALLDKLVVEWAQRLLVPRTHWNLLKLLIPALLLGLGTICKILFRFKSVCRSV